MKTEKSNYKKIITISFLMILGFVILLTIRLNDWPWPWYFSRAAGIVAYLFLFLIMLSGIMIRTKTIYDFMSPSSAWTIHQYIGITLTIAIFAHIFSLIFDSFLGFSIKELLIPFSSEFDPIPVGLGVIALYIFAIVMMSSLFYKIKAPKLWRLLHYLAYPIFILVFIHGVFIGTDTSTPWMQIIYWATASVMVVATGYRMFYNWRKAQ